MAAPSSHSWTRALVAMIAAMSLPACTTLGYYGQLARGEYSMLAARRPIARVIADPATDASLKSRLQLAAQARAFASEKLDLPRNASYTTYADIGRAYATWNVFATPEFSVEAITHCYLIVGCLAYRGYFDQADADAEAARLRALGLDTWVGGSVAYSTLGWFADPILNTMLRWDDDELAATIFHELAHQRLFVRGDTEFNESFATFVQYEGEREWRAERGLAPKSDADRVRSEAFEQLVLAARERLRRLYAMPLAPAAMRERKHDEIERLRADYFALRAQWGGSSGYDAWIDGEINNAKLLPFGLYRRWVPAFAALFAQCGARWADFFAAAGSIARLGEVERNARLTHLQQPDASNAPEPSRD